MSEAAQHTTVDYAYLAGNKAGVAGSARPQATLLSNPF